MQKQISSPVVGYWGEAYTTTRDGRLIGWDPLQHYWETAESFSASRIDELKKSLLDTKKVGSIESFASSPAALISAEKKITKLFYTLNMRTKGHKCSSMLDCEQLNKTYGYNYQSCSETSDGTKICVQPISAATCEEAALKTNTPCSIYGGENWQHLTCYSKMIKDKSFCAYNAVEVYLVSAENVDGNLKYYDIEHVMTSYDKDISSSTEDIIPPTPALANDNMVYFGTPRLYSQNCQQSGNCDGYVYAYKYGNYEYNFSWKYSLQNSAVFSAPIIDKQGFVIAAGTHSGELHAIDNRGVSVWINKDSGVLKHHVYAPPAIGIDGEVYLVTENPTGKSPASYLIRYEPK